MVAIKLLELKLKNFKGFSFVFSPHGSDADVFGDNSTGKTTLADAFSWLLFDKDSLGRSDFAIKNLDAAGNEEHMLEHSVEAVLAVDNTETTLKKIYKEIWTKKRGSAQATFSGHTNDFYVDGVPVQKKEYTAKVAEIAGDEATFRLLSSPTVFPALPWQKQRETLMTVCGDITDADVIASDLKLAPLPGILGKHKLEDYKKIVAARRTEINKELTALPIRIDEVRRGLPDITSLNRSDLQMQAADIEADIKEANLRLQGIDNGSNISDLSKRLALVNDEISGIEAEHRGQIMQVISRLNMGISEIDSVLRTNNNRISGIDTAIARNKTLFSGIDVALAHARDEWGIVDAETFHDGTPASCAACGQSLPSERVQEAREKALAAFNLSKANRLSEIEIRGQRLAGNKDELVDETNALMQEREAVLLAIADTEAKKQSVSAELEQAKKDAQDFAVREDHIALVAVRDDLTAQMYAAREGISADTECLRGEIYSLESTLRGVKEYSDRFTRREAGEKRTLDLMDQEKLLAKEYEKLEEEIYLMEQFIRAKVSMLTVKINSMFEIVEFKLFSEQINGGLSEVCEITVNGIPYGSGLNSGARINAGLDVIKTLSDHYGIAIPIFCDNAESVSRLIDMNTQVIRLVVSENDKVLRVERAREMKREAA